MFYTTREWNTGLSFRSASYLRVAQVAGLGFLFVPISLVAYVGMPPEKSNNVAGLLNFSRNIGSSIGTSMVTTLIARRSQVHQNYLTNHVTQAGLNFPQSVQALAQRLNVAGLESTLAQRQAYARIYRQIIAQATTLAYIDVFMILGVTSVFMFLLSFALKKNEPGGGGGAAVG
jgi:DHA2 family multidrug resistance protein